MTGKGTGKRIHEERKAHSVAAKIVPIVEGVKRARRWKYESTITHVTEYSVFVKLEGTCTGGLSLETFHFQIKKYSMHHFMEETKYMNEKRTLLL